MTGACLLVPIKPLDRAKSRLRAFSGDDRAHADLALAVAVDTVTAARAAAGVDRVVAVTSDLRVAAALAAVGVGRIPDDPDAGLNAALAHAAAVVHAENPSARLGALQADLPALRAADLAAAIRSAADRRAFCPDHLGTGTTLLLAAPGAELDPRFGPDSAARHAESGAVTLRGPWPSLRCDVDTPEDLDLARRLGLGPRTAELVAAAVTDHLGG